MKSASFLPTSRRSYCTFCKRRPIYQMEKRIHTGAYAELLSQRTGPWKSDRGRFLPFWFISQFIPFLSSSTERKEVIDDLTFYFLYTYNKKSSLIRRMTPLIRSDCITPNFLRCFPCRFFVFQRIILISILSSSIVGLVQMTLIIRKYLFYNNLLPLKGMVLTQFCFAF